MIEHPSQASDERATYQVAVRGHEIAMQSLMRGLGTQRAAQAYLLAGPPGVGKRTVARFLAQALLCPDAGRGGAPCGACRTCRLVRAGTFGDLHLLQSPVRIEAVRDLQHMLALAPSEAARRVAVVPDLESASIGAANCLLKTLEEPPAHAVLVLTCSAPERVPATVRSRCRSVNLRPLPEDIVAAALREDLQVDQARAALIAGLSDGRIGWAVEAIGNEDALRQREAWLARLGDVLAADAAGRLSHAAEMASVLEGVAPCVGTWRGWWRDVLLVRLGLDDAVVNRDRTSELVEAARSYPEREVLRVLRLIEGVLDRLAAHANERLALEVLLLGLPR